jgi:hypothetical protein
MSSLDIVFAGDAWDNGVSNEDVSAESLKEVFKGTEEETLKWLEENYGITSGHFNKAFSMNVWVRVGDSDTAVQVATYVNPKYRANARDSRKKFEEVLAVVSEMFSIDVDGCSQSVEELSEDYAKQIMDLFK